MDTNGTDAFPVVSPALWVDNNWMLVLMTEAIICVGLWASVCQKVTHPKKGNPLEEPLAMGNRKSVRLGMNDRASDGVQLALNHVQEDISDLRAGGMSKMGFALGLLNIMVTVFVLGALPEHLWLVFLAKCIFLIPLWWKTVAELHNGHLFILDFCWCGASYMGLYFARALAGHLQPWQQKSGFLIFYTCGMGPMSWANLMLGNGITFHAIIDLTSNFIHLTPSLVALAFNLFPHRVAEAWPGRFPTREEILATSWAEIYLHGAAFYLVWVLLHGAWLLTVGVDAPDKGYNTVFDWANKKSGWGAFLEKKGIHGVRKSAFYYLLTHCVLSNLAIAVAAVMIKSVAMHAVFVAVLVCGDVWAGAGKYHYLITRKTARMLTKLKEAEEKKADHDEKDSTPSPFGEHHHEAL